MPRLNIYLPDALARRARRAELNMSAVAQDALRERLAAIDVDSWLDSLDDLPPADVAHAAAAQALDEARQEFGAD